MDIVLPSDKISTFAINVLRQFYATKEIITENQLEVNNLRQMHAISPSNIEKYKMVTISRTEQIHSDKDIHVCTYKSTEIKFYSASQIREINTLSRLCFPKVIPASEVEGQYFYGSQFVDRFKADGSRRSRHFVAACDDQDHGYLRRRRE